MSIIEHDKSHVLTSPGFRLPTLASSASVAGHLTDLCCRTQHLLASEASASSGFSVQCCHLPCLEPLDLRVACKLMPKLTQSLFIYHDALQAHNYNVHIVTLQFSRQVSLLMVAYGQHNVLHLM